MKQRNQLVFEGAKSPSDYGEIIGKTHEGMFRKETDKAYHLRQELIRELIENDDRPLEGLSLSDQDIISVRLGRNAGAIRKSILNAVDKAIELKASLIQVS